MHRRRNVPKLSAGAEALGWQTALRTDARQFVDVAENFPGECLCVLETLGAVCGIDAEAREQGLSWEARRQSTGEEWSVDGVAEVDDGAVQRHAKTGAELRDWAKPCRYMLRHWPKLTLFLRQKRAARWTITSASGR